MSDISGLSSRKALAFYDRHSSSWRTSQATFLSDSMSSSVTWPRSGMTRSGVLYERPMSERATPAPGFSSSPGLLLRTPQASVTEPKPGIKLSGRTPEDPQVGLIDQITPLLPTPVAQDDGKSPEAHMAMRRRMKGGERDQITSLSVMARQAAVTGRWDAALLPTPAAGDGDRGPDFARRGRQESGGDLVTTVARMVPSRPDSLLPTPTSRDGKGRNQRNDETCLPGAVSKLLPTPDAAMGLGGHERRGGTRGDELLLAGLAKAVSRGEPTDPPSPEPPSSPDDPILTLWT